MSTKVKNTGREGNPPGRRRNGTTKISSKSQITIPAAARREAGLELGDQLKVEAIGDGQIRLVREVDPMDKYRGCLTGVFEPGFIEKLRAEWDR